MSALWRVIAGLLILAVAGTTGADGDQTQVVAESPATTTTTTVPEEWRRVSIDFHEILDVIEILTSPSDPRGYQVWDRLAVCEQGGNWQARSQSYTGGLGFLRSTWRAWGGEQYAPAAHEATREQQIDIARYGQAMNGWKPWPACSIKLGLRSP